MITGIKSSRVIFPDGIRPGYVYFREGKILYAGELAQACDELLDYGNCYIAPGFIDLHTHGAKGYSYSACSEHEALEAIHYHMQHGTTTLYPTIAAAPLWHMEQSVKMVAGIIDSGSAPISIPGVHMEGPYLSLKQVGAMCPEFLTPPQEADYMPILEKYSKYIKRWGYAPENDPEQAFCRALVSRGILPAVCHSDATYEDLLPAFEAGCTLVTHLYSCTSTITRTQGYRHLGIIETAYLLDDMGIEIITDGKHLPMELLRMIFKCKDHKHIALITDSISAAGQDLSKDNRGMTGFLVEDGVCKLLDRSAFAGSIATTDMLLRNAIQAGCTVEDAVSMMTAVPARIMNLPKGKLEAELDADVTVFDENLCVKAVFAMGKQVV